MRAAIFETLKKRETPYDRDSFKRVLALSEEEDMLKYLYEIHHGYDFRIFRTA